MKKYYKIICLIICSLVVCYVQNVKAEEYCPYSRNGIVFNIVNNNGSISVSWSKSLNPGIKDIILASNSSTKDKFFSDGKFKCPANLRTKLSDGGTKLTIDATLVTGVYAIRSSKNPINGKIEIQGDKDGCEGVLGGVKKDLSNILKAMRILAPILVAIYTTYDYVTAILAKDAEKMKKSNSKFVKRLVLMVVLYLLPVIINLLLGIIDESYSTCIE